MRQLLRRPAVHYAAAVLAVLAAFLLREAVSAAAGSDFSQYVVFYPTIMTIALLAGLGPALLAILLAAGVIVALWFLPLHILPYSSQATNLASLVFFVAVCVFLALVAELSRRNRQKAAAWDKEAALRQSRVLLEEQAELLRLSFDAIIVWKMGGGIESWNRGAEELYGFTEAEAVGREVHDLLKTQHAVPWVQFEALLREKRRWHGELCHTTREGRTVTVSSRLHIGRGAGPGQRVLQIDRDITEQKRVRQELERAHDELEEKVQRRTAELQAANRKLLMVSACDQALAQIGDEAELVAVICQIIHDEGPYPLVWVGLRQADGLRCVSCAGDHDYIDALRALGGEAALAAGPADEAARSASLVVAEDLHAAAVDEPWSVHAVRRGLHAVAALPLLHSPTDVLGVMVVYTGQRPGFEKGQLGLLGEIVNDLAFGIASLRARAERDNAKQALESQAAQLRLLAGELVRTEQRERRRIAQLLHDQLQQLLAAALYGMSDLREGRSAPPREQVVSRISGLLRECIAVSRSLTSELGHPALAEPDITAGLEWLAGWMQENHGLSVSIRGQAPVLVPAEETRTTLLQAVKELLFNVVKHAGVQAAEVHVADGGTGRVAVTVTDHGIGFDPRPAEPVRDRGTSAAGGGLGLFSMRERLALAGGGLEVESTPGSGSRITAWVPVSAPDEVPQAAPGEVPSAREAGPAAAGTGDAGRIRLLLVDDHLVVRNGLALQLGQQPDMEVVGEAADGAAAIEMAAALRPDVVTMDVSMPGMGGAEATRRIHAAHPGIAVIGLSMFDDARQAAAMRDAGAEMHLSKGASIDTLVEAIRACAARMRGRGQAS